MSEEELDDLSMPEEIGETDSQDEMYEHFSVTVDKGQGMLRIDKFLVQFIQNATRNRVQNAIRAQNVLVNDAPVKPNYKVRPGDVIRVVMPTPVREDVLIPENIPLNIVYEDDDLLIVDKPAGMVVHPGHGNWDGTLVNALLYHCGSSLSGINGEGRWTVRGWSTGSTRIPAGCWWWPRRNLP